MASAMLSDLAIPRIAEPDEITRLVLFVASDQASFSTGSEFIAHGVVQSQEQFRSIRPRAAPPSHPTSRGRATIVDVLSRPQADPELNESQPSKPLPGSRREHTPVSRAGFDGDRSHAARTS